MKAENYFKKNGFIYGVSEKYEFGEWQGYAKKFDCLEKAEKWLKLKNMTLGLDHLFLSHTQRDIYRRKRTWKEKNVRNRSET